MKRIISVWMPAARTVIWKLLLIAICMATVQTALFWRTLSVKVDLQSVFIPYADGFGALVEKSHLQCTFALALTALCTVLCLQGCQSSGSKTSYTLRRLPMREETVTLLWAMFHAGCLVILWACQLAVIFGFWVLYNRYDAWASGDGLELFLSFYHTDVLHSLLPLDDVCCHVRSLLWILSLSLHTAAFGYYQRRGSLRMEFLFLLSVGLVTFGFSAGQLWANIWLSLLWLLTIGIIIWRIRRLRYETD